MLEWYQRNSFLKNSPLLSVYCFHYPSWVKKGVVKNNTYRLNLSGFGVVQYSLHPGTNNPVHESIKLTLDAKVGENNDRGDIGKEMLIDPLFVLNILSGYELKGLPEKIKIGETPPDGFKLFVTMNRLHLAMLHHFVEKQINERQREFILRIIEEYEEKKPFETSVEELHEEVCSTHASLRPYQEENGSAWLRIQNEVRRLYTR